MNRGRARFGTTLIELMAALALAGLVLVGSTAMFSTLRELDVRMAQRVTAREASRVGSRRLRDAVLMQTRPGTRSRGLTGDATGARFDSRCIVAGGWLEQCAVDIQLVVREESTLVELRDGSGPWNVVLALGGIAQVRYLERGPSEDRWLSDWRSRVSQPIAVALVAGTDTMVFLGGSR